MKNATGAANGYSFRNGLSGAIVLAAFSTVIAIGLAFLVPFLGVLLASALGVLVGICYLIYLLLKISKVKRGKFKMIMAGLVLTVAVAGTPYVVLSYLYRNLAAEAAGPIEKNLRDVGGVKKCSRDSSGHGPDNLSPWYDAIYELPGDRESATELARAAFKKSGYNLTDGPYPGNPPKGNKYFSDKVTKRIPYPQLMPGTIDARLMISGNSTYEKGPSWGCFMAERKNPPTDKTTISITVNLTEFKH